MAETYYDVLGVPKTATQDEIQSAYRKLMKQWHPDKFTNATDDKKKEAEEMSRKINEAYATLSDPKLRKDYDNPQPQFDGFGGFGNFGGFGGGFDDLFSRMNGFGGGQTVKRGSHVQIKFDLTVKDLFSEVKKKVKYDIKTATGKPCPHCGGIGVIYKNVGTLSMGNTCPYCGGTGLEMKKVRHECEFTINGVEGMPQFDDVNHTLMFKHVVPYEGNVISKNRSENGNLIIVVTVKLPKGFVMETATDVARQIEIPVVTAMVGGEMTVDMIDGSTVSFKVRGGTEEGTKVRFSGKGLPSNGKVGDMYGYVHLKMPKSLTNEEKNTLEELKTHKNFK